MIPVAPETRPLAASPRARHWLCWLGLPALVAFWFALAAGNLPAQGAAPVAPLVSTVYLPQMFPVHLSVEDQLLLINAAQNRTVAAPELEGGTAWLNTAKAITMKDLRGKIVILDFWTLCCINCIHVLPDLAKLERKYANQLVVIGVHSPKFPNEKDSASIRKAILRYEIRHPVVNDADMKIWQAYRVNSWPTLWVIDPESNLYDVASGEGNYDFLDKCVSNLIKVHKAKKTLKEGPSNFELAQDAPSPLYFPGKVLADEKTNRLFIADSTNHRIVVTDLQGKRIAIAGTGKAGKTDGPFDQASFDDPQGMALKGDTLYVADRRNHMIRALDLKEQTVKTIAGIGQQNYDPDASGPALKTGLNSPWDLCLVGDDLFMAMAGRHQIWTLDLARNHVSVYAGDGNETLKDGQLLRARFAQPSGLTTDGKYLYVADSETSSIRAVPLGNKGQVWTIVGQGLFEFGDVDGQGIDVRLQHALGVLYLNGKLYVADTYNSKIKEIDPSPERRTCRTFVGDKKDASFNEPGGISHANGKLYVADTNAHRIRVVDLKTRAVSTLTLTGVEPVKR